MIIPQMLSQLLKANDRVTAKKTENKVGAGISPCLISLSTAMGLERQPLQLTYVFILSCSSQRSPAKLGAHPNLSNIFHNTF